jgi:hypothetical protein
MDAMLRQHSGTAHCMQLGALPLPSRTKHGEMILGRCAYTDTTKPGDSPDATEGWPYCAGELNPASDSRPVKHLSCFLDFT